MSSDLPFTPKELLEFWQLTWFPLSEMQKRKFLSKEETRHLCKWQRSDVMKFLKIEKKLQIVLWELRAEAQRNAEFERIKKLDESYVAARRNRPFQSAKHWCWLCGCNHLGEHNDRESYL